MRIFSTLLTICLISIPLYSQSLRITSGPSSAKYLNSNVSKSSIQVMESNGDIINSGNYTVATNDPSFKIYPLQNGSYIVRENIANFVLFDSFGSVIRPISNSAQTEGGEKISELATNPLGKTIVLYNPEFRNGSKKGSKAKILGLESSDTEVFYREDEVIKAVRVAESGEFVAIAYGKEGSEDEVIVMDRYGNEIRSIEFDQEVKGLNLYGSGSTLTVFSGGRVAVYDVLSGERLGSSSFRGVPLQFANYSGSDQTIVGLTGDLNGATLSNIEVRIINIAARKIATQEFSGSIQINDLDNISLNRTGRFSYILTGMSKDLKLQATF